MTEDIFQPLCTSPLTTAFHIPVQSYFFRRIQNMNPLETYSARHTTKAQTKSQKTPLSAFPKKIFTTIQIIAAIGLIVWGACEIYSYITTTFFFRDAMWLASGILNILLGCLLCTMPVTITVSTLTFLFAFVLLVNGIQKITWGSRLSFFRVIDTKYLSLTGWVNLLLGIIFLVMPFQSALVINYIIATYLVVAGLCLLIEAVSMKKI